MDDLGITIMRRYIRYVKKLERLGKFKLAEEIILKDVQNALKHSEIMMACRDKKKEDFDGSILEYLLSVSMEYLVWQSQKQTAEAIADYIISAYTSDPWDVVNFLRLFMKKPNIFYRYLGVQGDERSFLKLAKFWFELYEKDSSGVTA
ncbi:MAG: hypothetical protein ABSG35_10905 [Syntrophobacteraceae bacterium]|jgi:hypothetical protein